MTKRVFTIYHVDIHTNVSFFEFIYILKETRFTLFFHAALMLDYIIYLSNKKTHTTLPVLPGKRLSESTHLKLILLIVCHINSRHAAVVPADSQEDQLPFRNEKLLFGNFEDIPGQDLRDDISQCASHTLKKKAVCGESTNKNNIFQRLSRKNWR